VKTIDLNIDVGEGHPFDDALAEFATSANVGCGIHAGSLSESEATIRRMEAKGLRIGVHPGYPDRDSAGRTAMAPENQHEYLASIFRQVQWFSKVTKPAFIKPHGAFYHDTAVWLPEGWRRMAIPPRGVAGFDPEAAYLARYPGIQSLSMLLRVYKLGLIGFPGTAHETLAQRAEQPFFREGFVDRGYDEAGRLRPRGHPEALLRDETTIRAQVRQLIPLVDTLCLHGDTPDCVEIAAIVVDELRQLGITPAA
jgi:UPF0271 protein